jgi:hypothetical protein
MPTHIHSVVDIISETKTEGETACAAVSPLAMAYPDELTTEEPHIIATKEFDRPVVFRRKDLY